MTCLLLVALLMGGCASLSPVVVCDNTAYPHLDKFPNDANVCTPVLVYRPKHSQRVAIAAEVLEKAR